MISYLLDFLFPSHCVYCKNISSTALCKSCLSRATFYDVNKVAAFYAVSDYCSENRALIHSYKYYNNKKATDLICQKMHEAVSLIQKYHVFDAIVSVPAYNKKNHLHSVSNYISKMNNIPLFQYVYRIRETAPQSSISIEMRKANVENCFSVSKKNMLLQKKILIIDDIYTTGATIQSLLQEIKKDSDVQCVVLVYAATKNVHA